MLSLGIIYVTIFWQDCSLIIKTVEESGAIMREIRDLEDQVFIQANCTFIHSVL